MNEQDRELMPFALFAVGSLGCAWAAFRSHCFHKRAKDWPTTRGLITESKIIPAAYRRPAELVINYDYFLPEKFSGFRVTPEWQLFLTSRKQKEYLERYPNGAEVDVFFDPKDPRISCLNPRETNGINGLVLTSCVLLLPAIGYFCVDYFLK
jgi:hypothetical protein